MSYLELLVEEGKLSSDDAFRIESEVVAGEESLEDILLKKGLSKDEVLDAKGRYFGIPTKDMSGVDVSFDILDYIPEESAKHYKVVPLALSEGALEVGVVDPENLEAKDALQFISSKTGVPYKLFLITQSDFEKVLKAYSGLTGEVTKALDELETELSAEEKALSDTVAALSNEEGASSPENIVEDAPVTKIVATMLRFAIEGGASDIHVEPMREQVRVRFRVDGALHTSLTLPIKVLNAVVARIKILSKMKIDEKRKPQDNSFSAHIDGRQIDFRVSTFPTYYGEKVVIRILDPDKGFIAIDELGMSERNLKLIKEAIHQPYGLVLISGPTGSGKSTTLYSMLSELDSDTKNILSLEDPVEYNILGVNQSQVKPEIGYTFATGLRTTLRQDPDIIMVGEIRDKETAQLAIQAALTGHLVLSTIHTNSAIGVIPRLVDMGVDPYLIAPTLILAIAQRLVRTLCPDGGKPRPLEGSLKMMVDKEFQDLPPDVKAGLSIGDTVYEAVPTKECPMGTKGRAAVFEVMPVTHEIERVILEKPTEPELYNAARKEGMLTMKEDAMLKAFKGVIPFEEVNKL
jgi:type IV pilus assembly protein PilB